MRHLRPAVLSLTILFCLILLLTSPAQVQPAAAGPTVKSTLCGKLAFLEDSKTGTKLIGLIPCGQSRPIIFQRRPSELLDYYRFKDVTIVSGPVVRTTMYGPVSDYITKFDSYTAITSCNDCRPSVPGASPAGSSPDLACSTWALEQIAAANPELGQLPAYQEIGQNLEYFAKGQVLRQKCGLEIGCQAREIGRQLGARLGPVLRQEGFTNPEVTRLFGGVLANPDETGACRSPGSLVLHLLTTLNQQGFAIDALLVSGDAALLAADAQGTQAGMDTQGQAITDIPGAQVVASEDSTCLLLPAGQLADIKLHGLGNGAASLEAVLNDNNGVQYMSFKNFPVYNVTQGELDLSVSPPILQLDAWGKGQFQPRQATYAEEGRLVLARVTPPTPSPTAAPATPTVEPSPTATVAPTTPPTLTPAPVAVVAAPATATSAPQATPGGLCPLAFGVAALPGAFWLRKKKAQLRSSTPD
jgi:hypothetical protein